MAVSIIRLTTFLNLPQSWTLLSVGLIQLRNAINIVNVCTTSDRESCTGVGIGIASVAGIGGARLLARRSSRHKMPAQGIPYDRIFSIKVSICNRAVDVVTYNPVE